MPDCAISVSRPTVLSVTVLPPVLGPVTTSVVKSVPIHRLDGTTFSGSMRGWRARIRLMRPSSLSFGGTARMLRPSAARAKIMSIFARRSRLLAYSSASGLTRSENSARMRSISLPLLHRPLLELVAGLHHGHGLDEQRRAAARLVVDDAGHVLAALGASRARRSGRCAW